jgi:hypothetical protein
MLAPARVTQRRQRVITPHLHDLVIRQHLAASREGRAAQRIKECAALDTKAKETRPQIRVRKVQHRHASGRDAAKTIHPCAQRQDRAQNSELLEHRAARWLQQEPRSDRTRIRQGLIDPHAVTELGEQGARGGAAGAAANHGDIKDPRVLSRPPKLLAPAKLTHDQAYVAGRSQLGGESVRYSVSKAGILRS